MPGRRRFAPKNTAADEIVEKTTAAVNGRIP
jgi:hypothetical protein